MSEPVDGDASATVEGTGGHEFGADASTAYASPQGLPAKRTGSVGADEKVQIRPRQGRRGQAHASSTAPSGSDVGPSARESYRGKAPPRQLSSPGVVARSNPGRHEHPSTEPPAAGGGEGSESAIPRAASLPFVPAPARPAATPWEGAPVAASGAPEPIRDGDAPQLEASASPWLAETGNISREWLPSAAMLGAPPSSDSEERDTLPPPDRTGASRRLLTIGLALTAAALVATVVYFSVIDPSLGNAPVELEAPAAATSEIELPAPEAAPSATGSASASATARPRYRRPPRSWKRKRPVDIYEPAPAPDIYQDL